MTATQVEDELAAQLPRTFYLDAGALVKRYMTETGTAWVEAVCADENNNALHQSRPAPVDFCLRRQ